MNTSSLVRPADPGLRQRRAAIRELVRTVLDTGPEASVVVRELECTDPGCPPVETVLAVLEAGRPPRSWSLHGTVASISDHDVRTALREAPHDTRAADGDQ